MNSKTPQQIAAEHMVAFTVRDGDVEETSAVFIQGIIAEAIEADRALRENESRIPPELEAYISEDVAQPDYSLFVLDEQTANHSEEHGPEAGDCYHDVVVITDEAAGERATKYTMNPDGQIDARAI